MCFRRIGIIGLGLIGGAIAKTCKTNDETVEIAACDKTSTHLGQALKERVIDQYFASVEELAAWADLIIIATPLSELFSIATTLTTLSIDHPLTVIDISSVKGQIIPVLERLSSAQIEFVSTHPMAGKGTSDYSLSSAALFEGGIWLITHHSNNQEETLQKIERWICNLKASPVRLSPKQHDEQVALISHLPLLISQALLAFVEQEDPEALQLAGTGFQSMTRLAKSPPELVKEITESNQKILQQYWDKWLQFIQKAPYGNP